MSSALCRPGLLHTVDLTRDGTLCLHHECLFGSKFERKEMKCCDVFQKHKKKAVGIHTVKLQLAMDLKEKDISVTPWQKFCRNCCKMVVKKGYNMEHHLTNAENSEEESQSSHFEVGKKELDISFERAEVSPIK